MGDLAIRVQNVSKQYRLGSGSSQYKTLRESVANAALNPIRRFRNGRIGASRPDTLCALKGVSFDVKRGEVVGIVGRNGAGKSTLLKILSRITKPTAGRAEVYGRVGSLLEVGTGFHPELTGRENIYLNGAILGMKRAEIERKFDEIVSFAEVERFLDTPVKHYSSGMYMRLAFAVAAHLEAEILVVDEVLAVGDAIFQKKCLGKMSEVAHSGRAVLFASHVTSAVVAICQRGLLLDHGVLEMAGTASEVTQFYQSRVSSSIAEMYDLGTADHYGTGKARFTSVRLTPLGKDGAQRDCFYPGMNLQVDVAIHAEVDIEGTNVCAILYDPLGYRLVDVNTALKSTFLKMKAGQDAHVRFCLEQVLLKPGLYLLGLWMGRGGIEHIDGITYATSFAVEPDPNALVHTEVFPGVYQCNFTHEINVLEN